MGVRFGSRIKAYDHRIHAGHGKKQEASETLLDRRGEIGSKKRYTLIYLSLKMNKRIKYLVRVWNSGRRAIFLKKLDTRLLGILRG